MSSARRNGSMSRAVEAASKNKLHMDQNPRYSRINDPSNPAGRRKELDNVMKRARKGSPGTWDRKLLEVEEKDPNRWRHTGYKQLYMDGSRSSSSRSRSRSPVGRARSPMNRSKSLVGRARSPIGRARSPVGRARSPLGRARSPVGRARSPVGRARSTIGRARSPVGRARSPIGRARSPPARRSRSPVGLGKKKSRSPVGRRSRSPRKSPRPPVRRRSGSPRRRRPQTPPSPPGPRQSSSGSSGSSCSDESCSVCSGAKKKRQPPAPPPPKPKARSPAPVRPRAPPAPSTVPAPAPPAGVAAGVAQPTRELLAARDHTKRTREEKVLEWQRSQLAACRSAAPAVRIKREGERREAREPREGREGREAREARVEPAAVSAALNHRSNSQSDSSDSDEPLPKRISLSERFGKMAQWSMDRSGRNMNMRITRRPAGLQVLIEDDPHDDGEMEPAPVGSYPEELLAAAPGGTVCWDDVTVRYDYYKKRGYLRGLTLGDYVKWEEWWYKYQEWLKRERAYERWADGDMPVRRERRRRGRRHRRS